MLTLHVCAKSSHIGLLLRPCLHAAPQAPSPNASLHRATLPACNCTQLTRVAHALATSLFCSSLRRRLSFLAALAAPAAAGASCTPQPISRLALRCYLSLSEAIADALLTAFPRVSDLTIITFDQEDVHSAAYGIMQLVSRYGAQLQRLELRPLSLPPLALYSLSACTGLLRLELTHEEFPTGGTLGGAWLSGSRPCYGFQVWVTGTRYLGCLGLAQSLAAAWAG